MKCTAIEQENRSGVAPERLDTAIERGCNIPITNEKIKHLCLCVEACKVCACREGVKDDSR